MTDTTFPPLFRADDFFLGDPIENGLIADGAAGDEPLEPDEPLDWSTANEGARDDGRTPLDAVLRQNQVVEDGTVRYGAGLLNAFFGEQITTTERSLLQQGRAAGVPVEATVRSIRTESGGAADEAYPPPLDPHTRMPTDLGTNDGHNDAFRHAYASARLSQELGPEFARAFVTAHEGEPGNAAHREAMDVHNNELGLRIARENPEATPEELAGKVQLAIEEGEAIVIDENGHIAYSDEVGVGFHTFSDPDVQLPGVITPPSWDPKTVPKDADEPSGTKPSTDTSFAFGSFGTFPSSAFEPPT